jgi:rubrerythrin
MSRAAVALALSPLFAVLLSGCPQDSCSDFKGGTYMRTVVLTPDEYAAYESGNQPAPTTGPAETTGDSTGGSDDTTGAPAEMLTPDEVCHAVCLQESLNGDVTACSVGAPDAMGNIPIECELPSVCEGRGHACVRPRPATRIPTATAWLARAAHDEAASVHAFNCLSTELALHGAPESLLKRLRAAADDEVRHAARITRLAHEHHATVPTPELTDIPARDLLAIALENAIEGCVHETWAALSAAHQARRAATSHLRTLYSEIAADEARHAELAWALDTWLMDQLTPRERALVETARRTAIHDLRITLAAQPFSAELAALGLPDPTTAAHLAAELDASLWSLAA